MLSVLMELTIKLERLFNQQYIYRLTPWGMSIFIPDLFVVAARQIMSSWSTY
jgi:hypothetical protein